MFLPVVFLPLAAVLINDAKTDFSNHAITVDIATSEPVMREDVRGVSGGPRRLYIYLNNTVASRREFGAGPDAVVVHPRARYTKLEIPTPARCAEPVSIEQIPAGIRVRATCRDVGLGGNVFTAPAVLRNTAGAETPEPDAPRAAMVRGKVNEELLRAALALPPGALAAQNAAEAAGTDNDERAASTGRAKDDPAGNTAAPSAEAGKALSGKGPEGAAKAGVVVVVGGKDPPVATTTVAQPDAPTMALAGTSDSSSSPPGSGSGKDATSGSSVVSTIFAVALLVGLGVAAAVFARRRVKGSRMIRIVETASIGPKRSLVVACIGGRTMVLGVSEAGVSLLDSQGSSPVISEAPARLPPVNDVDTAAGLRSQPFHEVDGSEQKNESSLLSRLFPRSKATAEDDHRSHDFENLLSESLEDEELRRKLSLGEAGRVA